MYNMRWGTEDHLNDLIQDWLINKNNLIGIQIGSYRGESTELFVNSNTFKILYAIDPWDMSYDNDQSYASTKALIFAEKEFDNRFKNNQIVKKIKAKSTEVVDQFENESIDFIYIDGCHTYEAVREDLNNYYPKVKKSGIIAGHDWHPNWPGVKKAVFEFFQKEPLKIYEDGGSWVYIKK